jgi:hypothetical protein
VVDTSCGVVSRTPTALVQTLTMVSVVAVLPSVVTSAVVP